MKLAVWRDVIHVCIENNPKWFVGQYDFGNNFNVYNYL